MNAVYEVWGKRHSNGATLLHQSHHLIPSIWKWLRTKDPRDEFLGIYLSINLYHGKRKTCKD